MVVMYEFVVFDVFEVFVVVCDLVMFGKVLLRFGFIG